MKSASSKLVTSTLNVDLKLEVTRRAGALISTRILRISSSARRPRSLQILTIILRGLQSLKNMKSTQNTSSDLNKTGPQPKKMKPIGTKESSTLKSYEDKKALSRYQKELRELNYKRRQLKSSSMTGKLAGYIPITTIKNPFTVSQHSPNTLLCSACGQSTFTLISDKSGRKPFIVTRCTNCGQRGMVVPENFSKLLKILKE